MRVAALVGAMALVVSQGEAARAQVVVPKQVQLGAFGACLLKQAPRLSAKLLRTRLGSPEEKEAANTLAQGHSECVHGGFLSGRSGAIRGAVAEAAFEKDSTLLDTLAARPAAIMPRPAMAQGRRFLIDYAHCLIAEDPQHTAAFLRTPYASAAERDGFVAFGKSLSDCTPVGMEFHVDIPDLRNQIAAVAWQSVSTPENSNAQA